MSLPKAPPIASDATTGQTTANRYQQARQQQSHAEVLNPNDAKVRGIAVHRHGHHAAQDSWADSGLSPIMKNCFFEIHCNKCNFVILVRMSSSKSFCKSGTREKETFMIKVGLMSHDKAGQAVAHVFSSGPR